jgi:gliding motility-associated-like protein
VCKEVSADVHTAIDVPTGFSPNGDGNNDILYVRGGAIETMNIKIFNRWGEKVFESNSLSQGWDGKFKGKPQEMDAYAYILTATFIDGTTALKKGNITLVR